MTPERPILFSDTMVRAILAGTKSVTRRLVRLPKYPAGWPWEPTTTGGPDGGELGRPGSGRFGPLRAAMWNTRTGKHVLCPHGATGDLLWVREAWGWRCSAWDNQRPSEVRHSIAYRADGSQLVFVRKDDAGLPRAPRQREDQTAEDFYSVTLERFWRSWRPSMFMPRWASRLTLRIVSVRAERLQDISADDVIAEGVPKRSRGAAFPWHVYAREDFQALWDSINGHRPGGSWAESPWVWRIEFARSGGDGGTRE